MAMNEPFDWRRSDRRLFLAIAILFPLIVFLGFGPTYYFKPFTGSPPLSSTLVHIHGLAMTAWVLFFIVQVWLIRSKRARLHMKLGMQTIIEDYVHHEAMKLASVLAMKGVVIILALMCAISALALGLGS